MLDLDATLGSRLLVIYDGTCGLCNHTVRWLLARDRCNHLCFAPSSSPAVAALLVRHGFTLPLPGNPSASGPGTILVVRAAATPAETVYTRSTAVVVVLAELPGPWPLAARLLRIVPLPIRDLGYRLISRWRYHIWGRLGTCPLPAPEQRAHFL